MSARTSSLIPRLEKVKAGLGAAGMAAVGFEAVGAKVFGSAFGGIVGRMMPIMAAATCGIAAAYFTSVSEREAALEFEASKESYLTSARGR